MNVDGSNQARLTDSPGFDGNAEWSPDGSKIVFATGREGTSAAVYLMNSDGSDQHPLIPGHRCEGNHGVCLGDEEPSWSPDGSMVAFVGFASDGGYSDIFIVNADGTNERRLTSSPDFESSPSWQPIVASNATSSPAPTDRADTATPSSTPKESPTLTPTATAQKSPTLTTAKFTSNPASPLAQNAAGGSSGEEETSVQWGSVAAIAGFMGSGFGAVSIIAWRRRRGR